MRGDSIRDLYAKTLALMGLGVLAATGALVDYWPSGVALPRVESGFVPPDVALALAVPEDALQPWVVRATADTPLDRHDRPVLGIGSVSLASFIRNTSDVQWAGPYADAAEPVAPAVPASLAVVAAHDATSAPFGEELSLSEPVTWRAEPVFVAATAPVALADADDGGLISDVMRVTKSSLVLTGRKTGASIVGAFRAVGGAVRKALPN